MDATSGNIVTPSRLAFIGSAGVLAYTYVGFPILVLLRGRLRPRAICDGPRDEPSAVSVLIAAHNEESSIDGKVRSVLRQDYPGRLECIVVSDGSTDGTVASARAVAVPPVLTVLDLPRAGKATALNRGLELANGDIVVFTDANSDLAPGALRALVAPFADDAVGGVAGDQRYVGDDDAVGERTYWDLDRAMKQAMSRSGSVTSATGALYAMRRELVPMVPDGVTDDFFVSTNVIVAGRRLVFASDAVASEPPAGDLDQEYRRKVRVMTRGLRAVWLRRSLLVPGRDPYYALQLLSHKVLRRLSVVALVTLLASAPFAARDRRAHLAVGLEVGLGVTAATAWRLKQAGRSMPRPFALLAYFAMVNVAAAHALVNVVTARRIDRWTPQRGT